MGISGSAIVSSTSIGERFGPRMRALRPGRCASGPHHTAHSSTSPANEVHWASVPSGMASCGIDGDSLAPVAGTAVATCSTKSQVGWISSSRKTRLIRPCRPVLPGTRRAGSSHTPTRERSGSRGASNSSASPTRARESGHGPQVDVGDGRGDRVDVDPLHGDAERRHRHGIRADAAAEVVHRRQRGVVEPPGVGRRDLEPGGLLEPVGGVEHVVGELAELGDGPGAQPLLGQQRGDEVGVVALLAEPVLQAHHLALVVRGQASQDRPTVG